MTLVARRPSKLICNCPLAALGPPIYLRTPCARGPKGDGCAVVNYVLAACTVAISTSSMAARIFDFSLFGQDRQMTLFNEHTFSFRFQMWHR
jgi:hypothetical protein